MSAHETGHSGSEHGSYAHVSSLGVLFAVFAALMVLTVLTVAAVYVDLGKMNLILALIVATIKATLVALYFMHLRYDSGFNRLAFFGCFLFVFLFVGITLMDSGQYQPDIDFHERVITTETK